MQIAPRTILQVGVGLGLGTLGYLAGSSVIEGQRQRDINADPIRVLSDDGKSIEEVPNTPHTGLATFGAAAVGSLAAFGGAVLALGRTPGIAETGLLRALGGIGLLGAGAGIIGGALASAASTADMTSRPNRTPSTNGISITPP